MPTTDAAPKTAMQRFLDGVEKVGNMVPHPVIIFLILIGIVVALSHALHLAGVSFVHEAVTVEPPKLAPGYVYDAGTAVAPGAARRERIDAYFDGFGQARLRCICQQIERRSPRMRRAIRLRSR